MTKLPLDVGGFGLSPDGRQLAVALEVYADCANARLHRQARRRAPRSARRPAASTTSCSFRHWDTWEDGRRSHLFVAARRRGGGRAARRRDEGHGRRRPVASRSAAPRSSPSRPTASGSSSPRATPGREEAWSTNIDLFVAPIDGSAAAAQPHRRRTGAPTSRPVFSPDGKTLAYLRDGARRLRGRPLRVIVLRRGRDGKDARR